jgi:riboflavin kinase / FMN adenylyltransferase
MSKLITSLNQIKTQHHASIVTIGNFDGVHLGHQEIIKQVKAQAQLSSTTSLVIIFEPQPKEYFLPLEQRPARITSLHDKVAQLAALGIDYILCLKFNRQLQQLTAQEFIDNVLLDCVQLQQLIIGADFCCGSDRKGTSDYLEQQLAVHNISVTKIDFTRCKQQQKISSSSIRIALEQGDLAVAKKLLGRDFAISGKVVAGQGLGKQWGTPTANIHLEQHKLIISGIFVVLVNCAALDLQQVKAIASIGVRPSISDNSPCLEVHLFNKNIDLYSQRLEVVFLHKLRNEDKFDDIELLKQQIALDKRQALEFFASNS